MLLDFCNFTLTILTSARCKDWRGTHFLNEEGFQLVSKECMGFSWVWVECTASARVWILNVPQRPMVEGLTSSPVAVLGSGGAFKRRGSSWSQVIGGVPLKGTWRPQPFPVSHFASLMPWSEQICSISVSSPWCAVLSQAQKKTKQPSMDWNSETVNKNKP
jgi:hypothetical protein